MAAHLLLLCHGETASTHKAAFPDEDEPLESRAVARLNGLRGRLQYSNRQYASPALRARQTAEALDIDAPVIEPALADLDFGRWRGLTFQELLERTPEVLSEWMQDAATNPYDGESVSDLVERMRGWLESHASLSGVTLAITHASVIRAGLVAAIGTDARTF